MISNEEIEQAIAETSADGVPNLGAVIKLLAPKIDPEVVASVREAFAAGQEANPREVRKILLSGSIEERMAVRGACCTSEAIARNQDLNLARLSQALAGDSEARAEYENGRIIIPEVIPQWRLRFGMIHLAPNGAR
jgi:hypothetical protein